MKMLKVASMLLACSEATQLNAASDGLDDKEVKLSQSFASAFAMEPPKLMATDKLPGASNKGGCPSPGEMLTWEKSGKAFLDGCYMNTTRSQDRNEATGEEAQNYLYMWKHACAFTKWVPSNQFMYSNLDYNAETMTLERFGFIGMDKKCFWGSIGVLWKRPLPVEQILPNATNVEPAPTPKPKPTPKPTPWPKDVIGMGQLVNRKSDDGICLGMKGTTIKLEKCNGKDDVWTHYKNGTIINNKFRVCMQTKSSDTGTKVSLAECRATKGQFWNERPTAANYFQIITGIKDGVCVDLPGITGNEGLKAQVHPCRLGRDNMEFKWQEPMVSM